MDTTTKETVARMWRDGWSIDTIARKMGTTQIGIMAQLRRLRDEAGAKTNEELRQVLKGWQAA